MPNFEKQWIDARLSDEELKELEVFPCEHPEAGDMIQGTGGLRKLQLHSGGFLQFNIGAHSRL